MLNIMLIQKTIQVTIALSDSCVLKKKFLLYSKSHPSTSSRLWSGTFTCFAFAYIALLRYQVFREGTGCFTNVYFLTITRIPS